MADDWKARALRIGTTGRRSGDELSTNGRVHRSQAAGAVEGTRAVENRAPSRPAALLQVIRTLSANRPPMASQDSICQLCSKPISSGRLVFFEHGELFHLACRSRALRARSLNVVDAAQTAETRAASLAAETDHLRRRLVLPARSKSHAGRCPVCGEAATHTDWRPRLPWVAIEGCTCGGYFVEAEWRVPGLTARARRELAARIRGFRARKQEVWLTVTPPRSTESVGRLTIRTRRPERW
jgi:hypothetical protein